jgi:cystathionine beta-lyase
MVSANANHWEKLHETYITMGCCAGPDDVYAVLRGLRTMAVRLEQHEKSALTIANSLKGRNGIARVLHPALPDFPGHDLWTRDFSGSSGLFSIVLDGGGGSTSLWQRKAHAFLDALKIFGLGYSWGGYESLCVHVYLGDRIVANAPSEGPVMRLQIGLEDPEDLLADIQRGIDAANAIS